MPGYVDLLRTHAKEVQSLEGKKAEEFMQMLQELRSTVTAKITRSIGSGGDLTTFRLREVLQETEMGISLLKQKADKSYAAGAVEAAELAIKHTATELERLQKMYGASKLAAVAPVASVKHFADPEGLLANHFSSSVARYGEDVLNGVRRQLFVSIRTGDTFKATVDAMQKPGGALTNITRPGAERIVRTETAQAYGAAQHETMKAVAKNNPGYKKMWLHIGSFICPVCIPLHGTTRPMNGTWTIIQGVHERKVAHAPAHPNCVCRISIMNGDMAKQLAKGGYLGTPKAK